MAGRKAAAQPVVKSLALPRGMQPDLRHGLFHSVTGITMLKRPAAGEEDDTTKPLRKLRFVPGVVIVRWKRDVITDRAARRGARSAARELPNTVSDGLSFLRRNHGLKRVVDLSRAETPAPRRGASRALLSTEMEAVAGSLTPTAGRLRGVTMLEFDRAAEVGSIVRALEHEVVEYAQPAPTRWLAAAKKGPADPKYNGQWGLPAIEWFHARRPNASAVRVAVLDSGIDRTHPDLRGIVAKYDSKGFSAKDLIGHGTHVSGILAATTNNKIGISGVANCKLCCWKVFGDKPASDGEMYIDTEAYYRALEAAGRTKGVKVINMSLGGVEEDLTETDLVKGLVAGNDLLIVAAMGNEYREGNPVEYPASLPGVLAVGAIGPNRRRAGTSNTGKHIGLVAPGTDIISTLPLKTSPIRDETEYEAWSGTSMATPFVSGVAALVWARHPKLTAEEVRSRLLSTTTRIAALGGKKRTNTLGSGLLNARKALDK